MTVSIEGEWGMGKTSFMKQLEQELKRQTGTAANSKSAVSPHIVSFNAWTHDKDEAMWASFALEFARGVNPKGMLDRLCKVTRLSWKRLDKSRVGLAALLLVPTILLALPLAIHLIRRLFFPSLNADLTPSWQEWQEYIKRWTPIALGTPAAAAIVQALRRAITLPLALDVKQYVQAPQYKEKLSFLNRFHDDFSKFVEVYVDRATFVLVDDLDRCEVPKAAELLQALNLMMPESAPISFILAMDREKVAMGVAIRNKDLMPFIGLRGQRPGNQVPPSQTDAQLIISSETDASRALSFGYSFIEKFIQLPFRVPRLSTTRMDPFLSTLIDQPARSADDATSTTPRPKIDPTDTDPPGMREVIQMVAPALDFNPRRIKQFLNLLRLRLYIAEILGQLRPRSEGGWWLPQLAKVVALELRWPLVLEDLLQRPEDFAKDPVDAIRHSPFARGAHAPLTALLLSVCGTATPAQYELGAEMKELLPALYGC